VARVERPRLKPPRPRTPRMVPNVEVVGRRRVSEARDDVEQSAVVEVEVEGSRVDMDDAEVETEAEADVEADAEEVEGVQSCSPSALKRLGPETEPTPVAAYI